MFGRLGLLALMLLPPGGFDFCILPAEARLFYWPAGDVRSHVGFENTGMVDLIDLG